MILKTSQTHKNKQELHLKVLKYFRKLFCEWLIKVQYAFGQR